MTKSITDLPLKIKLPACKMHRADNATKKTANQKGKWNEANKQTYKNKNARKNDSTLFMAGIQRKWFKRNDQTISIFFVRFVCALVVMANMLYIYNVFTCGVQVVALLLAGPCIALTFLCFHFIAAVIIVWALPHTRTKTDVDVEHSNKCIQTSTVTAVHKNCDLPSCLVLSSLLSLRSFELFQFVRPKEIKFERQTQAQIKILQKSTHYWKAQTCVLSVNCSICIQCKCGLIPRAHSGKSDCHVHGIVFPCVVIKIINLWTCYMITKHQASSFSP